ncbi:MAG: recombinase zinc beta ribbon domain-containing protein [Ruminococcus sp.]|nr:recombinase zinc beta ribbon domain-containing protein [Ruminococcus sp.]
MFLFTNDDEKRQRLITSRKRNDEGKYEPFDNIFCGLLKCPDCGHTFAAKRSHRKYNEENYFANFDYYCNSYVNYGRKKCSTHRIIASDLYNAVLADIKRLANNALENDRHMISEIAAKLSKNEKDGAKQAERDLKKANKRLAELDRLFAKLFESHANEEISDRNFNALSVSYESEQKALEVKIAELNTIIKTNRENGENAETFVDIIKNYADITELS